MTFDLILAGVVALFGLFGLSSGALRQLRHWAGLLLAALAARPAAARLTPFAAPRLGLPPPFANAALSVLLFVVLFLAGTLAARGLLSKVFPDRENGRGDRAFGFALGAAKGAVLAFAALSLLVFFEKPLTDAFGAPPAAFRESRAVAFARRRDLFAAVPVPVLAKLQKLIDAAKDPAGLEALRGEPELRALLDDPGLKASLSDGEAARALKSGDLSALKRDPRLKALLDDPRLAAR